MGEGGADTYLEDLHLLKHELLHLLVILRKYDDLLHCPAVWNGPGRTSVGLRVLGKGQSLSPFPTKAPCPLGQWGRAYMLRFKDLPWTRDSCGGTRTGQGGRGQGLPSYPDSHLGLLRTEVGN